MPTLTRESETLTLSCDSDAEATRYAGAIIDALDALDGSPEEYEAASVWVEAHGSDVSLTADSRRGLRLAEEAIGVAADVDETLPAVEGL